MKALDVLGGALRRATRWRLLLITVMFTTVCALFGAIPLGAMFGLPLRHHPLGAKPFVELGVLDLLEVGRSITERGHAPVVITGLLISLIAALLLAPFLAGATLAQVRTDQSLKIRALLQGAGEYWGRLFRLGLTGLIPIGIAGGLAGLLGKFHGERLKHITTDLGAERANIRFMVAVGTIAFLMLLTVDAGRALLAARPQRRSGFLAWTSGTWLVMRKPLATIGSGLPGLLGVALAFGVILLRAQVPAKALPVTFLLSSFASAAIFWGRAVRLAALTEIAAADATRREERKAAKKAAKEAALAPVPPPLAPVEIAPPTSTVIEMPSTEPSPTSPTLIEQPIVTGDGAKGDGNAS